MGRNHRDPRFAFETIWDVLVQKGHGWFEVGVFMLLPFIGEEVSTEKLSIWPTLAQLIKVF